MQHLKWKVTQRPREGVPDGWGSVGGSVPEPPGGAAEQLRCAREGDTPECWENGNSSHQCSHSLGVIPSYVSRSKWAHFNAKEESSRGAQGFSRCQCAQRQAGPCAQSTGSAPWVQPGHSPAPRATPGFWLLAQASTLFCCPHVSRWEVPWRCGYNLACPALFPSLSSSCCIPAIHYSQALLSMDFASVVL